LYIAVIARRFNSNVATRPKLFAKCSSGISYYAAILRSVAGLVRPSVRPSVRLPVCPVWAVMLVLILVLVLKDSLRTKMKSLS